MARGGTGPGRARAGIRMILLLGSSLLALAGCGGLAGPGMDPRRPGAGQALAAVSPPPGDGLAGLLASTGETNDEDRGFLTPPVLPPVPVPAQRDWWLGVRAGLVVTTTSEEDWDSATSIGVFYRGRARGRLAYELGLDRAAMESEDGSTSSRLLSFRGEVLLGGRGLEDRRVGFCLLLGAHGISERAELEGSGRTESRTAGGINMGLLVGSPGGGWDVRSVLSILVGSDNAKTGVSVAAGFAF